MLNIPMTRICLLLVLLVSSLQIASADQQTGSVSKPEIQTNPALDNLFSEAEVSGTFVLHEVTLLEEGDNWILHAKTGWSVTSTPHIGWWVGWVVYDDRVFSFALNIDMPNKGDAAKRIELGKASLRHSV